MKRADLLLALTLLFLLIPGISASCEEGQIDINSASLEELEGLYGIGPSKAQSIVSYRTDYGMFNSINDLTKVSGIKEVTLGGIKSHTPTACVEDGETAEEDEEANVNETGTENNNSIEDSAIIEISAPPEVTELKYLDLNPKAIKSEENSQKDRRDYAIYGLFAFGIMLGLLFLIKNLAREKRKKNEFE